MLNPGFEDLTKRSLLARFIKKFPKIQSLLDGESASGPTSSGSAPMEDSLIVSKQSFDKKLADLDIITKEKIPRIPWRLKKQGNLEI